MASFNRVILIGNVTRDIECKYLQNGTAVTEIGMAVNDKVKKGDQWIDEVTFVDVTLWGRTAEVAAEYLSKGSPVFIEGRLKLDSWEKDGKKNYKMRVIAEKMQMLGSKRGDETSQVRDDDYGQAPATSQRSAAPPPGDDIPFAFIGFMLATALGSGLFT